MDDSVASIGAANTVTVRDGKLSGANTDVLAAMDAVNEAAVRKWAHGVYGMRALVLGAGGVSRALAWGLKREAVRVMIANRTFERGKALKCNLLSWDPWPHMGRPLDDVREELGIPPLS